MRPGSSRGCVQYLTVTQNHQSRSMNPPAVTMECASQKKPPSMTKKPPPAACRRFLRGDKEDGACKVGRYICARCGMHRGEHRYAGIRDELLPPRKRSVFRRLVQFQVQSDKKREKQLEEGEILTTKGKRTPRRKLTNVVWAGLSKSLRARINHIRCDV